jgi:nucleoside-diphosphate-sugar epimerase
MIVVTGAAGFIGGHLVRELGERGVAVVGIDRRPGADVLADLTDPAAGAGDAVDLLRGAEAVFHLAGAGGVRLDGPAAEATWWRCNVEATEAVLAAVPPSTPLVVTSSSSVYGGVGPAGRPCREGDRLRPRGGYARSKVEVERRVAARRDAGGRALVARPFTVAGEGQRPDMALARWLAAARAGRPLVVHGSVARRRDVTDVRQVAAALVALAERDAVGTVNLGTGVAHTLGDMVAAVARVVGPTGVVIDATHRHDVDATLADTRRCRRLAGFVPRTDLVGLVRRQAAAAAAPAAEADTDADVGAAAGVGVGVGARA